MEKELNNKQILAMVCFNERITFHLEDESRLEIDNRNSFWRLRSDKEIIASSDDFSARSFSDYCQLDGPDFWPMDNVDELEDMSFDMDDDEDQLEKMFKALDAHADEKVQAIMGALEGQKIVKAETSDMGDLSLSFENGMLFELFIVYSQRKTPFRYYS